MKSILLLMINTCEQVDDVEALIEYVHNMAEEKINKVSTICTFRQLLCIPPPTPG
jgi:hypothetical protein